jgi:hypothetical protein
MVKVGPAVDQFKEVVAFKYFRGPGHFPADDLIICGNKGFPFPALKFAAGKRIAEIQGMPEIVSSSDLRLEFP